LTKEMCGNIFELQVFLQEKLKNPWGLSIKNLIPSEDLYQDFAKVAARSYVEDRYENISEKLKSNVFSDHFMAVIGWRCACAFFFGKYFLDASDPTWIQSFITQLHGTADPDSQKSLLRVIKIRFDQLDVENLCTQFEYENYYTEFFECIRKNYPNLSHYKEHQEFMTKLVQSQHAEELLFLLNSPYMLNSSGNRDVRRSLVNACIDAQTSIDRQDRIDKLRRYTWKLTQDKHDKLVAAACDHLRKWAALKIHYAFEMMGRMLEAMAIIDFFRNWHFDEI